MVCFCYNVWFVLDAILQSWNNEVNAEISTPPRPTAKGPKRWTWMRTWTRARRDPTSTHHPALQPAVGPTGTTETEVNFSFVTFKLIYLLKGVLTGCITFIQLHKHSEPFRTAACWQILMRDRNALSASPSTHANRFDQREHLALSFNSSWTVFSPRRVMSYCTSMPPPLPLWMNCIWCLCTWTRSTLKIHAMTEIAPGFSTRINV